MRMHDGVASVAFRGLGIGKRALNFSIFPVHDLERNRITVRE